MNKIINSAELVKHMDFLHIQRMTLEEQFEVVDYLMFFKKTEVELLLSCKTEKEFIYRSAEIIGKIRSSSGYDKISSIIEMLNRGRMIESECGIPLEFSYINSAKSGITQILNNELSKIIPKS